MKSSRRIGTVVVPGDPGVAWSVRPRRPLVRKLGIASAVFGVLAAGTASALFVDYLAERAAVRAAKIVPTASQIASSEPAKPLAAPVAETAAVAVASRPVPPRQVVADAPPAPVAAASTPVAAFADGKLKSPAVTAVETSLLGPGDEAETDSGTENAFTSAIPSPRPGVAAQPQAEEPDVAAVEPEPETVAPEQEDERDDVRTVRVRSAVNMRSRPASGSKVIGVIPARATVDLISCKMWCEVRYSGKRGWIFKSFVGKT